MNDQFSTGSGKGVGSAGHERADDEKLTREQAERWASFVSAQVNAARQTPKPSVKEPTNEQRADAGDLTPGGAKGMPAPGVAKGVASGTGEGSASDENRMVVRVDGGDLGEVALTVDRKDGALRVTISAADAAAEAVLGVERIALMQALQSHGITVDSVNVVRVGNSGTVPAQRSSATQRARESAEADSTDGDRERRKQSRKLNIIG